MLLLLGNVVIATRLLRIFGEHLLLVLQLHLIHL